MMLVKTFFILERIMDRIFVGADGSTVHLGIQIAFRKVLTLEDAIYLLVFLRYVISLF